MKIKFISKIEEIDHYWNPNYFEYEHPYEDSPKLVPVGGEIYPWENCRFIVIPTHPHNHQG